jgi:phosphoribosylformimino-5-aminoimidazole carboxamide ribotide isomerase
MLIIPAIDLQDGCVVRYVQGKREKKVYSRDPVKTAKYWVKQGARLLHVVDLDGAFTGKPKNLNIVKDIAQNCAVPIEFGGGVRSIEAIRQVLSLGVKRVVLGTKAVTDEAFLSKARKEFKDKVVISIDAKNGKLAVSGWKSACGDAAKFALKLKAMGFKEVIYTDTLKDGTLSGPNIKGIKELLKASGLKIIASGGIAKLEDLKKLKCLEKSGVIGVITGKAIYEGRFTLKEAMSEVKS